MRAGILLLKASCVLLSALVICGQTAPLAYCQQIVTAITTAPPEFINDMWMDMHRNPASIMNLIGPLKSTPASTAAIANTAEHEKKSIELIHFIIKKNSVPENKQVAAATDPANSDTIITAQTVTTPPAAVQPKESNAPEVAVGDKPGDEAAFVYEEEVDPLINKYAEMISVEPQDINNYPLYKFIDHWYGTRYRWGGMDSKGIDCSAFSQKLYGNIYSTDIARTSRQQHRHCERIKSSDDASEGDLVFFRIHRIRISHVGVYLANGYFVHASRSHGVVISSLHDKYWQRRYAGCGKVEKEDKTVNESDFMQ